MNETDTKEIVQEETPQHVPYNWDREDAYEMRRHAFAIHEMNITHNPQAGTLYFNHE